MIIVLVVIGACTKDNDNSHETGKPDASCDFTLASGTILYDEDLCQMVTVVDSETIILNSGIPENSIPKTGDILCCPVTPQTPDGFFGKVISISIENGNHVVKTGYASLDEAFETICISRTLSLSEYIDGIEDENGNLVPLELVSDEVWEELQADPDRLDDDGPVGTKGSSYLNKTLAFGIEQDDISGYLYFNFEMDISIDKPNGGETEMSILIRRKSGIQASLKTKLAGTKLKKTIIPYKVWRFPGSIPVGPIAIKPAAAFSVDMEISGSISVEAEMNLELENMEYMISGKNGELQYEANNCASCQNSYCKFKSIGLDGSFSLCPRFALQFAPFCQDLIAFGVECVPVKTISASASIDMEDAGLLTSDISLTQSDQLTFGLYCYSKWFSEHFEKLQVSKTIELGCSDINLMPAFSSVKTSEEEGSLSVMADIDTKSMMKIQQQGFAIYIRNDESNAPLEHKDVKVQPTRASGTVGVTFSLPDSQASYYVRPYVVADGNYYYGEDGQSLVGEWMEILYEGRPVGEEDAKIFRFSEDGIGYISQLLTPDKKYYFNYSYDYSTCILDWYYIDEPSVKTSDILELNGDEFTLREYVEGNYVSRIFQRME